MIIRKLFNKFSLNALCIIYLTALVLYTMISISTLPVLKGDTDIFYHLSGGRYILSHMEIPATSYFSFISPQIHWVDYYWLFQVFNYKIYSLFGISGLVFVRSVIFMVTELIVFMFLLKDKNKPLPYISFIFSMYFLLLLPRGLQSRPHAVSYLCMAAFLYILEFKREKAWILPLIATLWVNFHGIEYPVMILIAGAYLFETYVLRVRQKRNFTKDEYAFLMSLTLVLCCVYFTPHGVALLKAPFISTRYASEYITELVKLPLSDYFSFLVNTTDVPYQTVFNLFLIVTISAIAANIRKLQLSHFIMFVAAAVLIFKANRFSLEFSLLALPLISANPPVKKSEKTLFHTPSIVVISLILMSIPFINVRMLLKAVPVSKSVLPHGIVSFLKKADTGGTIMNHPNSGGYLEWELYPRYKIFMDMEIPFLFKDEDMFNVLSSFTNPSALEAFLNTYKPDYIIVSLLNGAFKHLISSKHPEYRVVFFDDIEVLYAKNSEITEKYALKTIDPFTLTGLDLRQLTPDVRESFLKEMRSINSIDPDIELVNQVLAIILTEEKKYGEALVCANTIIRVSPSNPRGYMLKGDLLNRQGKYEEAIRAFKAALSNATEDAVKKDVYKKLWYSYSSLKQDEKAYEMLSKGVDIFTYSSTYDDLYALGLLAFTTGKTDEAFTLFTFALKKAPDNDTLWKDKIEKMLLQYKNYKKSSAAN
ncbi:MAG: tetratricopeptide repeat protein [Nitrospirae bacterium]|nr:tetratricopeptide repeat protein [Nitrospirota bacterium]MBF0533800.1 tetratricopeptide repeat protein [Nitrospirota bacterium]MBF0615491.1 tetratricopeptide repeat protein [Nitrospirota bacterium]